MAVMTTEVIRDMCKERGLYESPQLNTKMYLHCRGFRRIQALDPYYNVKALFLDANAIETIENLDRLQELVTLCLDQNLIERIENLTFNLKIQRLNLSYNEISKVENLSHLTSLEDLNLSHNKLTQLDEELLKIPNLHNLDISHNLITDHENAVSFFAQMQQLRQIKFFGNKCWRNISHFRQKIINLIPSITYLDDKPVFEIERISAKAWQEGGALAEKKAREDYNERLRKAPPTDDWDERKHKVSERMRMALTRIDSNEGLEENVVAEQPSYDLDEWQHLEKYAQGWRSAIKREGLDAVREKVEANTFPLKGSTRSPTSAKPTDHCHLDGGVDTATKLGKIQFDSEAFHSWEMRQLAMHQKEEKENGSKLEEKDKSVGGKKEETVHAVPPEGVKKDGVAKANTKTSRKDHHSNENNMIFNPPTRMVIESINDYRVSSTPKRTLPPHTCSELDTMD